MPATKIKKVMIIGGLQRPDRTSREVCRDIFGPPSAGIKIKYTLVGFQARDLVVDVRSPKLVGRS